jgi:hypothetical protein
MKNHAISNITYNIVILEQVSAPSWIMTFERLFLNDVKEGEDFEFVYSLGEIAEDVMRLNVGERLEFNANRDVAMKNGAIKRMS